MSNCSVQTLEIVLLYYYTHIYLRVTCLVLLVWYLIESILCFVANSIKLVFHFRYMCKQNKRMRINKITTTVLFIQVQNASSIAIQSLLISLF